MPRRAAAFTVADVARFIRAAKREGCAVVTFDQGRLVAHINPQAPEPQAPLNSPQDDSKPAKRREIVL